MIIYPSVKRSAHAPVAQLDRVTDYESVGQGFESLPAYQKSGDPIRDRRFFLIPWGLDPFNATVRGTVACARLDGCNTYIFEDGENANESDQVHQKSAIFARRLPFFIFTLQEISGRFWKVEYTSE